MDTRVTLTPAAELAARSPMRFPNEGPEYRAARTALLAEELELRRHLERVARQRRELPPGGEVRGDYQFEGEEGLVDFAGLFRDKQTLGVYSFMFGPRRERPCPMCTSLLGPLDANAEDLDQRMSLVVVARSPLTRLIAFKKERGWRNLRLYTDLNGNYSRDYFAVMPNGDDIAAYDVFTRQDGTIRLFWAAEMAGETADPGEDPRGAPDMSPLWTFLDMTPEGRGDWYPSLEYR